MKIRPVYNSRISKWLKVGAITLYPFIFFTEKKEAVTKRLHKHEMIHVKQIRELGVFRFYFSYLRQYWNRRWEGLGHWRAYHSINFEVEAYRDQQKPLTIAERKELGLC
jgi:hypothetical protein